MQVPPSVGMVPLHDCLPQLFQAGSFRGQGIGSGGEDFYLDSRYARLVRDADPIEAGSAYPHLRKLLPGRPIQRLDSRAGRLAIHGYGKGIFA